MEHHPTRRTGKYYYIAALCLVVYGILTISQLHDWGGWFLSAFFVSLALAFLKNKFLILKVIFITKIYYLNLYHCSTDNIGSASQNITSSLFEILLNIGYSISLIIDLSVNKSGFLWA